MSEGFKRTVIFKKNGKTETMRLNGFTEDPASDLSYYKRSTLEGLLGSDKKSPFMIVVK